MIKILPDKEESKETIEPFFRLVITLGYGEHCDDTFSHSWMKIDDEKAIKFESLSDEEIEDMDFSEYDDLSGYITQYEAERIVNFFNSLWTRKGKDSFEVDHVVLNDGCDSFWWKDCAAMTNKEFDWFSKIYRKYQCYLFNPQIEHNWYGVIGAEIEYVDCHNKIHRCEVV